MPGLGDMLGGGLEDWQRLMQAGGQLPQSPGFPPAAEPPVDELGRPIVDQPELAAVPNNIGQQLGDLAKQAFQAVRQDPAPEFTKGAAPIPAIPGLPRTVQENVAALSAQRNKAPDPLEVMIQLGGGPGGSPAAAPFLGAVRRGILGEQLGRSILPPGATGTAMQIAERLPQPEAPQRYLTGPSGPQFRAQTAQGAVDLAKTEPHIIPNENGVGFKGAPENVKSADDLQRARADFDKYVELGSRIGGQNWYPNARETLGEITGAPPPRAGSNAPPAGHLAAQEYAAWSPQATPPVNQNWAIQAHNAYEMGMPLDKVRTGQQGRQYIEARQSGEDIKLGKKTGPYSESIDPTIPEPPTSANDIWHARALGYTKNGKPWSSALTAQQHVWMDGETLTAANRASELGLGGDKNWTAQKVQAAGWIGKRAEDIFNKAAARGKPITIEEALQQADVQYKHTLDQQTAFATYETIPGVGTGHLPEISTGDQLAREAYHNDPRSAMTVPGAGGQPYDVIYNALGAYQRPTIPITGIFEKEGLTDINKANAGRPLVSLTGKSGSRVVDPASEKMLNLGEGLRTYLNVNNMGAANYMTTRNRAGRAGDVLFNPQGQLSPAEVERLQGIGGEFGRPNLLHLGDDQAVLTNWEGAPAMTPKKVGELAQQLGEAAGPVQRVERQSLTQDFSKTLAEQNAGSGKATQQLLDLFNDPQMIAKVDASDQVRSMVRGMYERDAQLGREGKTVRQDVQNARKIIIDSGLAGLKAALAAGKVALPTIAAVFAGVPLLQQQQQSQQGG
jgi:hypothetical protein